MIIDRGYARQQAQARGAIALRGLLVGLTFTPAADARIAAHHALHALGYRKGNSVKFIHGVDKRAGHGRTPGINAQSSR